MTPKIASAGDAISNRCICIGAKISLGTRPHDRYDPRRAMDQEPRTLSRHRRSLVLALFLALLTTGCQSGAKVAGSTKKYQGKTGFVERKVVVDGFIRPFWVFIPPNYD